MNATGARSNGGGNATATPEGQPESTKELSKNLKWANLHILTFDAYDYFNCIQERATSTELFGTFVLSGTVVATTAAARWAADAVIMPFLVRARGYEPSPDGYFIFPSWEAVVFESVSRMHACLRVCVCVCVCVYVHE